jgi:hypothetical protein
MRPGRERFPAGAIRGRMVSRAQKLHGRHKHDFANWTVADDWPERVPVSEIDIDI